MSSAPTFLVLIEMSPQLGLLDGLLWQLVQTFLPPTEWLVITLVILQVIIYASDAKIQVIEVHFPTFHVAIGPERLD